jgi:protein transport protein SEC24
VTPQSPRGQLILPEAIKYLPLYALGLVKHPALRENGLSLETGLVDIQERVIELFRLMSRDVRDTLNAVYPRLYRVYPLHPEELTAAGGPRCLPPSSQFVESDNAYLLDDGSALWLYVGRYVDRERLEDWFSRQDERSPDFRPDSRDGARILELVERLRVGSAHVPEVKLVLSDGRSRDPRVTKTYNDMCLRLVEDSVFGEASYEEVLVKLHSKIQTST